MYPCPICTSTFEFNRLLGRHKKDFPNGSCVPRFPKRTDPLNRTVAPGNITVVNDVAAEDHAEDEGAQVVEQIPLNNTIYRFCSQCNNGRGMNATDLGAFMKVVTEVAEVSLALTRASLSSSNLSNWLTVFILLQAAQRGEFTDLTSLHEFTKFTEKLLVESDDGWLESPISVTSADVPRMGNKTFTATFRHFDMKRFLIEEYGNEAYRQHFAWSYKTSKNAAGQRYASTASTGNTGGTWDTDSACQVPVSATAVTGFQPTSSILYDSIAGPMTSHTTVICGAGSRIVYALTRACKKPSSPPCNCTVTKLC